MDADLFGGDDDTTEEAGLSEVDEPPPPELELMKSVSAELLEKAEQKKGTDSGAPEPPVGGQPVDGDGTDDGTDAADDTTDGTPDGATVGAMGGEGAGGVLGAAGAGGGGSEGGDIARPRKEAPVYDSEDEDTTTTVVIDNGGYEMKAGFVCSPDCKCEAGGKCGHAIDEDDPHPRARFPTVVGHVKETGVTRCYELAPRIGDQALERRVGDCLRLSRPSLSHVDVNWDDMEKIWHHTFYQELRVTPDECFVLLTEPPLNPKANRERMTQIMFETFGVQGMYLSVQAVLALYASGRTTGVAVDSGYERTWVVPFYEVRFHIRGRYSSILLPPLSLPFSGCYSLID